VAVAEEEDSLVFLHKVIPGGASRSYGIEAARLAGVPKKVIDKAREVLDKIEAVHYGNGLSEKRNVCLVRGAGQR